MNIKSKLAKQKEASKLKATIKSLGKGDIKKKIELQKQLSKLLKELKGLHEQTSGSASFKINRTPKELKVSMPILKEAIAFLLDELNIPSSIRVKFHFLKTIKGGASGFLELNEGQKNDFVIKIDQKLSNNYLVRVIAHELTHLRQVIDGYMFAKDSTLYWKGKPLYFKNGMRYGLDPMKGEGQMEEYRAFPPEAEAYKNQEELFKKVKDKLNRPIEGYEQFDLNYFDY